MTIQTDTITSSTRTRSLGAPRPLVAPLIALLAGAGTLLPADDANAAAEDHAYLFGVPYGIDGEYVATGAFYNDAPVYARDQGAYTWSLYRRANGKWHVDFNEISEDWAGTVAYATHESERPWEVSWAGSVVASPTQELRMENSPYAAQDGTYVLSGTSYHGRPVFEYTTNNDNLMSLYQRDNGRWYLDANEPGEDWSGTMAYATSASDWPWESDWYNSAIVTPTPEIQVDHSAYASHDGTYAFTGTTYHGRPVFEYTTYANNVISLYQRDDGRWYLDFDEPGEDWAGTAAYASSASDWPWEADWNRPQMAVCAQECLASDYDCYDEDPWTCVAVEPDGSYGTRSLDVSAAQSWVNTGLYLRAGEQVTISETGSWSVPSMGTSIDHGPCLRGDLVARIGLYHKDDALTCVEGSVTISADKDGILYVAALVGNDVGEGYQQRVDAIGTKSLTITSSGDTAPTVHKTNTGRYDFGAVLADRVELAGDHVILTVPTSLAISDQGSLHSALERLDAIYTLEEELRGARPHQGQRIRFYPDGTNPGLMLAGNPIRMKTSLVDPQDSGRITNAGAPPEDAQVWGFAHELGHDFTMVDGAWLYMDGSTFESWPNVFSIYALEQLGIPLHTKVASTCQPGVIHDYADWNAWRGLCFLMQFEDQYGWDFYYAFFDALNQLDKSQVPGGQTRWNFTHDLFESSTGHDVTPDFAAWGVPNPG